MECRTVTLLWQTFTLYSVIMRFSQTHTGAEGFTLCSLWIIHNHVWLFTYCNNIHTKRRLVYFPLDDLENSSASACEATLTKLNMVSKLRWAQDIQAVWKSQLLHFHWSRYTLFWLNRITGKITEHVHCQPGSRKQNYSKTYWKVRTVSNSQLGLNILPLTTTTGDQSVTNPLVRNFLPTV